MMVWLTGFLMAAADSVPGVSGGTIAYILKQYDNLFENINALISKDYNKDNLSYLFKLAFGWIVGFISAVLVISSIFEEYIYDISSLFLGLITVSIILVFKEEKQVLKNNEKNIIFTIIGFLIVLLLVFVQGNMNSSFSDPNTYNIFTYVYFFIVGIIAISAMLLPGISGSGMMLIFGVYYVVMDGVAKLLEMNFEALPLLISLGMGILIGAVFAVRIISKFLKEKRPMMIYLILGLLLGSIISVIQGPQTLEQYTERLTLDNFNFIAYAFGIIILLILDRVSIKGEK